MTDSPPEGPPRFVLGLTGYTCSGKSEVAQHLEAKGFGRLNLGDLTREAAGRAGVPTQREATWTLFKSLTANDPAWRVPLVVDRVERMTRDRVVVDGIRTAEEAAGLARHFAGRFLLAEVRVSEEIRLRRARSRGRSVDADLNDPAAFARWQTMDREETAMIDRLRSLVEVTVDGGR